MRVCPARSSFCLPAQSVKQQGMSRDGRWCDRALAMVVPRGGHKRWFAGLLLVLLSSWWVTGLTENDRRLLLGAYPELASAVARCRAAATGLPSPRTMPADDVPPPFLPLGNLIPLQRRQVLIATQFGGYPQWADTSPQSRWLEAIGTDTQMIVPGTQNGIALSTGPFRENCTVYPPNRHPGRPGYSFIYNVPLERAASDPDTTRLSEGERVTAAPARFAGSVDNSKGIMIGSQPEPVPEVTEQAPRAANNPRLVLDPIWIEAGALVDDEARAAQSHYLHSTVAMEWLYPDNWEARLGGRVDGYVQRGDDDFEKSELDYDETYLRYRNADRTVTFGAQTVLWGRVDELPPTDRLSVRDVSRFVLDDLADRRRAVPAVRWEEFVGEHKLDLLYVPQFRAAELPPEESVWFPVDRSRGRIIGLSPDPLMEPLVKDGRFVEEDDGFGGWGLRVSRTGHNLDYALTVQDARHSLPYYALALAVRQSLLADPSDVAGALSAAPATFIARHPRTWVLGGSLAFSAGHSTWRLEAAWLSDHPATTQDLRYTTVEALNWVAGVEFFPGDRNLRMSARVRGLHLLSQQGELLDRETIYTLFGDIENTFERGRWGARLRYSIGLDEHDVYLNPELAFQGREPHEFYLGYHYFDGAPNTPGGFHQHHDLFTLGWRARF